MSKTIVVLGAGSQVGYRLLPRLQATDSSLLAVTRSGKPGWAQDVPGTQWLSTGELAKLNSPAKILISVGPLALAIDIAADMTGLEQVVVLSSASLLFKTTSSDHSEQKMMANLLASEQQLEQLCDSRNIGLTIFRPTLVYGSGLDDNLCRLARWITRFGWMLVAGKGTGLRQPIYSGDLAELILESTEHPEGKAGIFSVAGASQLSYREMVNSVFRALEKPPRVIELPVQLFAMLLKVYSVLRPSTGVSVDMAARQNLDLLVDTSRMRLEYRFEPGKFRLQKEHLIPP